MTAGNFACNRVLSFFFLFLEKKIKYGYLLPLSVSVTVKMDYVETWKMLVMQRMMTLLYEPKIESSCVVVRKV